LLAELSFTSNQVEKISRFAKENLDHELKDQKLLLGSKTQRIKEITLKIERLEERLLNDEIETITYKKSFTKLSAEKGSLTTTPSKKKGSSC
jgi:hypothetical protein